MVRAARQNAAQGVWLGHMQNYMGWSSSIVNMIEYLGLGFEGLRV